METRPGNRKINVIKVRESDGTGTSASKPSFEPMPQLYLELLENKEKIRQNLVNQEYEPDDDMSDISYFKEAEDSFSRQQQQQRSMPGSVPRGIASRTIHEEDDETVTQESTALSDEDDRGKDGDMSDILSGSASEEDDEASEISARMDPPAPAPAPKPTPVSTVSQPPPAPTRHEENEHDDDDLDDDDYLSEDFSDISGGAFPGRQEPVRHDEPRQGPVPEAYEKMIASKEGATTAPRLADLKKTGEYIDNGQSKGHIPDLHRIYSRSEEEEEEIKREILFKFEILKKSYPALEIPNYTIHTDLKTLTRAYENTLRRVSLDTNVDSYKQYLIGGFMLVEFVTSTWFSLDMQGFTQQQILNMNQYERLLIELGEKSYVPGGKAWPVELRLMGMILMNAFIFIISKIIMKKTGNNLINMMNAFGKSAVPRPAGGGGTSDAFTKAPHPGTTTMGTSASQQPFRRRMRGPSINPDDIPDLAAGTPLSVN